MKALTNNTDSSSDNGMRKNYSRDENIMQCMGFSHYSYTVQDCCFRPEHVFIAVSNFLLSFAWILHYIIYNFMFKSKLSQTVY